MRPPIQLPHDVRGEALCRHRQPGRCTWWCSYRRAVLWIGPVVAVLITVGIALWLSGNSEARTRVTEAFAATAIFLGVMIPLVVIGNARDRSL